MDNAWKEDLASGASSLGVPLSAPQIDQLAIHVDLLIRWNDKLNLTRICAPHEILSKHVLDSLAVLRVLPAGLDRILDIGSGAGFPGIPIAIARPETRITLVDAVGKKVQFCKNAIAQTQLKGCEAVHCRLEGNPSREKIRAANVVVSRAFTSLTNFLGMVRPYLAPDGSVIAMLSGREDDETLRRTADALAFDIAEAHAFGLGDGLGARRVLRLVPRGTAP